MFHNCPCSTCGATTCMALVWLWYYEGSLANCPIIHRVNKNGFGWNRLPVSCLKPAGRIVHSTDPLMYILIFHRSYFLSCNTNLQAWKHASLFHNV